MKENLIRFDYYYGKESEQFSFYRIPKRLFTDVLFRNVSAEAKVLYGLLLDRMSLSMRNGWMDEDNRVYIYFKVSEAMEFMQVGKEKCIKLFAELDSEKGCGLIQRKRQGLGRPAIIYVMNFSSELNRNESEQPDGKPNQRKVSEKADLQRSENPTSEEVEESDFQRSENQTTERSGNPTSGCLEIGLQEVGRSDANKLDINYNYYSDTEENPINRISSHPSGTMPKRTVMDEIDQRNIYRRIVSENVEEDVLKKEYDKEMVEGIVDIVVDAVCSHRPYLTVGGEEKPQAVVKGQFLKLDYSHVEYVLDCLKKNTTKVRNIKAYLLSALYNAVSTIGHYYQAEVNHDLYGGGIRDEEVSVK